MKESTPLSADALLYVNHDCADADEHDEDLLRASKRLVEELCRSSQQSCQGVKLTTAPHGLDF